ncbi:MAG TPA: M13 family metallopeptidase [Caulifigura sp.]|nr:M13 family metallopeptidase [Caulifigura sp.]
MALAGPAAIAADPPKVLASGIDKSGFDTAVRPQDNFFLYVNGGWIAKTEIPADKSNWGSFNILREQSDKHQREIIEKLAAEKNLPAGSEKKKISDLYSSLMDEALANKLGATPVKPELEKIDAIKSIGDFVKLVAELEESGVAGPLVTSVGVDSHNSLEYAVFVRQAGLGLPNRNYYLQEGAKFDEIRKRYPEYIAKLFSLAGLSDAQKRAEAVYALELKLAEVQWSPEDSRDATKTDNRFGVAELGRLTDKIDWKDYLTALGMEAKVNKLYVAQPTYIEKLGGLLASASLDDWKDYLRFKVLNDAASWLSDDFVSAHFDFYGKLIDGLETQEPRWQRAVKAVNASLGEAVGKVYVESHFSPDAKRRMDELVKNLLAAFQTSLKGLEWMSDETKLKAEEKRTRLTTKIGYPDVWKDYSALQIDRNEPFGNLSRAAAWDYHRDLARLGEPVDRAEWLMTPQTVNAYHYPRMNDIVFPAAILQPPFFNPNADDAVNYGGIGMVIGHETGHAFDDQGRKTDANGNLNEWWTAEDASRFKVKAQALVEQYNQFEPLPGLHVNGQLTLGENIGDLTGLYIAYKAYKMSLGGKEAPVIDGLTGDQRFFMGYAQIWRAKYREEAIRKQVLTDPHSPVQFRVNGPLKNFGPFYEAFNIKPGDGMYLPEKDRIQIW